MLTETEVREAVTWGYALDRTVPMADVLPDTHQSSGEGEQLSPIRNEWDLPDIDCPYCDRQMDRHGHHYWCVCCGYAFAATPSRFGLLPSWPSTPRRESLSPAEIAARCVIIRAFRNRRLALSLAG